MGIMTRMRDSMPTILFGLLVAFLITIIFDWGMNYFGMQSGQQQVVGEVNGKEITYRVFSDAMQNVSDNQKAQTGSEPDESQLPQLREQVWQSLVTQQLIEEQIQQLGIAVTDQELNDWVRSENPPEDLRRFFVDSTGQFRRDLYEQFLNNPNQFVRDPQGIDVSYGTKWLVGYEKNLRQRRLQEKLQSIVLAAVQVTPGEVLQRYKDQNLKFDALYTLFEPNKLVKDDQVQLTDADLRSYYDENLDQYTYEASRNLKYVLFKETPSAEDTLSRQHDIEDAAEKARAGIDFLQLVFTYSERPDSGAFFKRGELAPALERAAFSAKPGDIVGPILDTDGFHLLKVLEERTSATEFIHASHILLSFDAGKDSNAVKALARKLVAEAKAGKDFGQLVREHSADPGSAQGGGDLGWFTKGRMVKPFEDAAFKAKAGEIVGPVRTQFGLHIIKVHERDSRELKLANIYISIRPSSQTRDDLYDRAVDFAYNARGSDLAKEAQRSGFDVKETQVQEKGGVVPGIGVSENIVRWAFSNNVGSVSEPFSIPNGYAVLAVSEGIDAGVRRFEDVKESLRPLAIRKKKIEMAKEIATELREKLAPTDSLSRIPEFNEALTFQRTGPFTLANPVPGIGREQRFLGALSGLSVGEISSPIETARGVFLIQLVSISELDSAGYHLQKDVLRNQMLQDKRNRFLSDWLAKLKDDASIEDHREIFFR